MRAILVGPMLGSPKELHAILKNERNLDNDFIVGVDRGAELCYRAKIKPHLGIGDWDSIHQKSIIHKFSHLTLPTDKNRSDLFYAACTALSAGARDLLCIGFMHGRADHYLAALLDLSEISDGNCGKIRTLIAQDSDCQYIFLSNQIRTWQGHLTRGALISLFSLSEKTTGVSTYGMAYPLKNEILTPSSRGLSNVSTKKKLKVTIRKGRLLIVIPLMEKAK